MGGWVLFHQVRAYVPIFWKYTLTHAYCVLLLTTQGIQGGPEPAGGGVLT
jgi:hypothetical protein